MIACVHCDHVNDILLHACTCTYVSTDFLMSDLCEALLQLSTVIMHETNNVCVMTLYVFANEHNLVTEYVCIHQF